MTSNTGIIFFNLALFTIMKLLTKLERENILKSISEKLSKMIHLLLLKFLSQLKKVRLKEKSKF
jgi:hypothetical protein